MQVSNVLDTRSIDEAQAKLSLPYCPHHLTVPGTGAGFRARHAQAGGDPLGVFRLEYGATPAVVRPVPFKDFLLVSRPVAGTFGVGTKGRDITVQTGQSVALDPDSEHELHFGAGCRLLTIKLPLSSLDQVTRAEVATGIPQNPVAWNAVTRFLLTEVLPHGLLTHEIMCNYTVQLVAAAVLESFGAAEPQKTSSAAFQRALDFIEDRARDDIGLLDIATAAGVSARALQDAFRRKLGTTPLAYLRDVRLAGARKELRAEPARTVAEIAYDCGFGNLGRFAGYYQRRYGRLPSEDR